MPPPVVYCHLCDHTPHSVRAIRQVWYWDKIVYECLLSGRSSTHPLRPPVPTLGGMVTPVGSSEEASQAPIGSSEEEASQ